MREKRDSTEKPGTSALTPTIRILDIRGEKHGGASPGGRAGRAPSGPQAKNFEEDRADADPGRRRNVAAEAGLEHHDTKFPPLFEELAGTTGACGGKEGGETSTRRASSPPF